MSDVNGGKSVCENTTGTFPAEGFAYDTTGRVVGYSDFKGNSTTYTYADGVHAFPTTVVNALGVSLGTRTYTYDQGSLRTISAADENGVTASYSYSDPLDRLTRSARASGTSLESWTAYTYPSPNQVSVTQDQVTKGDGVVKVVTLYDGLGRPREADQYESSSQYIATTVSYDALGRVATSMNPSRLGDSLNYATTYSYDALGRVTKVQTADGSATTAAYLGNQTTVTDAAGKVHTSTMDALGRLTQVTEDPSGLNYTTFLWIQCPGRFDERHTRCTSPDLCLRLTRPSHQCEQSGNREHSNKRHHQDAYDANSNLIWSSNNGGGETCYSYDVVDSCGAPGVLHRQPHGRYDGPMR